MTVWKRFAGAASTLVLLTLVSGCAHMSRCERNTALGATIGGVTGSVVTDASTVGTVGGAVAGGVIGNRSTGDGC